MDKLISISQLSYKLNLISPNNKKPKNYILRYWEKEFKQIKPKIINRRRYYSIEQIELIKLVHFLLKNKGMTINGVKKVSFKKTSNHVLGQLLIDKIFPNERINGVNNRKSLQRICGIK